MGERWAVIEIDGDELLRCDSCYEGLCGQNVHLHIDADDDVDEVMCDTCWKKYAGER